MFEAFMPTVLSLGKTAAAFATKNSNALLTGLALTTLTGTALAVASAVPKIMEVEENKKNDLEIARNDDERKKIRRAARIKVAKIVIVPALLFLMCGGSIIGNAYINSKRIAALAAAYAISEQKIEDLEKAADEIGGPKKAALIKQKSDQLAAERCETDRDAVINTGHGEDLIYNRKFDYFFRANPDFVDLAFKNIQSNLDGTSLIEGETQRINDLHEYLNLPNDGELGALFGWHPGDNVGVSMTSTGKKIWNDGTSEYYTVMDYTAQYLGKAGQLV
jgi:hypothetical protein